MFAMRVEACAYGLRLNEVTCYRSHGARYATYAVLGKFSQSMPIFIEQLYIFGRFAFYGITRGEQLRTMITLCGFVCVTAVTVAANCITVRYFAWPGLLDAHHRRPFSPLCRLSLDYKQSALRNGVNAQR